MKTVFFVLKNLENLDKELHNKEDISRFNLDEDEIMTVYQKRALQLIPDRKNDQKRGIILYVESQKTLYVSGGSCCWDGTFANNCISSISRKISLSGYCYRKSDDVLVIRDDQISSKELLVNQAGEIEPLDLDFFEKKEEMSLKEFLSRIEVERKLEKRKEKIFEEERLGRIKLLHEKLELNMPIENFDNILKDLGF